MPAFSILSQPGDLLVGGAAGVETRLPGNATTARKFLLSVGDGDVALPPSWDQVDVSDVSGLSDALSEKADIVHSHSISDITNLQTSLDSKANLSGASFTGSVQVGTGSTMTSYEHRTFGDAYVDGCLNVGDKAQTTPINGGMLFARSGTSEPFIRFATQSGASGCGQIRGIDGGGIRITNFNGATEWFKIGADGVPDFNSNTLRIRTSKTPASANAAGNAGDICWDGNYLYICTATNTWRRIAHESWT